MWRDRPGIGHRPPDPKSNLPRGGLIAAVERKKMAASSVCVMIDIVAVVRGEREQVQGRGSAKSSCGSEELDRAAAVSAVMS